MPRQKNSYGDRALDLELDQLARRLQSLESGTRTSTQTIQSSFASSPSPVQIQVSTSDGAFSSPESGIEFDQADGFVLSQSGNSAKVNKAPRFLSVAKWGNS